jgi:hypothetical protein
MWWIIPNIVAAAIIIIRFGADIVHQKDKRKRILPVAGICVAICLPFFQCWEHAREESKHIREIKNADDAAKVRQDELLADNEEIRGELRPVLETAKARSPGLGDKEALASLMADVSRMVPKLEFLKEESFLKTDALALRYAGTIHIYYFRAQYPVPLNDVSVDLEFDGPITGGKCRVVPGTLITGIKENLTMQRKEGNRGLVTTVKYLDAGVTLEIEVWSPGPLKVASRRITP